MFSGVKYILSLFFEISVLFPAKVRTSLACKIYSLNIERSLGQALSMVYCPVQLIISVTAIQKCCHAKNLSSKFPKKKLVLAHPLASGSLELAGVFFTLSIMVCPISLRSASIIFVSTGFPEASLTQKTFVACSPIVITPALDTDNPFSRRILVTSDSKPTLSFAQSSRLRP